MTQKIEIDLDFLQKFAEFTKAALYQYKTLKNEVSQYRTKEASLHLNDEEFETAVIKVANALYDSDFISDNVEKRRFIKRALDDKIFLANTLIRVCEASDVTGLGKTANVKSASTNYAYDPVYARAFGFNNQASQHSILDL